MRQDVSALVSALMTIVRTQSSGAVSAPAATATAHMNEDDEDGDGDEGAPVSREKQEKQNGRERVVLLMHETRVLTASDATRVLLLLAREVSTWLLICSSSACNKYWNTCSLQLSQPGRALQLENLQLLER